LLVFQPPTTTHSIFFAASMLAVDFDMIERGAREAWPKTMEWYCAFGLLATLVSNNLREFERVPGLQLDNWVPSL
jgi:uncharacterized YccA/Bax inhibitor family protein